MGQEPSLERSIDRMKNHLHDACEARGRRNLSDPASGLRFMAKMSFGLFVCCDFAVAPRCQVDSSLRG